METHARTIVKALTWRVCAFAITVATAWVITRRMDVATNYFAAETQFINGMIGLGGQTNGFAGLTTTRTL